MIQDNYDVEAVAGEPQHCYPPPPPPPPPQQYAPPQNGNFQVVFDNPPAPQPAVGPQPVPSQYPYGHQAPPPAMFAGYAAAVMPVTVREPSLICGIGYGWILFILGFFIGIIPWYIGAIIFLCSGIDRREKPGCIACTAAAVVSTIVIVVVVIAAKVAAHH